MNCKQLAQFRHKHTPTQLCQARALGACSGRAWGLPVRRAENSPVGRVALDLPSLATRAKSKSLCRLWEGRARTLARKILNPPWATTCGPPLYESARRKL